MSQFDIDSLLHFSPPRRLCEKCCAINSMTTNWDERYTVCDVCGLRYLSGEALQFYEVDKHLDSRGCLVDFENVVTHGKQLARIAADVRKGTWAHDFGERRSLLGALLRSLAEARQFVHIATYGVSWMLLGALKLAAQRIDVRLIVSKADPFSTAELSEFQADAPGLRVQLYDDESDRRINVPHQKLFLIDDLLAFKGSANFTHQAWRKAEQGLDVVEVVTNLAEVKRINNTYFSPLWASRSRVGQVVELSSIPF